MTRRRRHDRMERAVRRRRRLLAFDSGAANPLLVPSPRAGSTQTDNAAFIDP